MVSASDFVDGVTIRWRRLAAAIVGASVLAYFEGIVATLLSLADIPISVLARLASFFGDLITVALSVPTSRISFGWAQAAPFVREAGILGFIVALLLVLLMLYIVAEVVSRVR